jgi:hypothetical protein
MADFCCHLCCALPQEITNCYFTDNAEIVQPVDYEDLFKVQNVRYGTSYNINSLSFQFLVIHKHSG